MTEADAVVPVARTTDPVASTIWVDALEQEGIRAAAVERGVGPALGGLSGVGSFVIVVRESQIGAARSIIADLDGAGALLPVTTPEERNAASGRVLQLALGGIAAAVAIGLVVRFLL